MSSSKTIGIIGGGQLGQMMAISAIYMGHKVIALDPAADCPASRVAEIIVAPYNDVDALRQLAERCDVLTYEFENVDADGLDAVIKEGQLPQGTDLLRISQNRIFEKDFLSNKAQVTVAPYKVVTSSQDLADIDLSKNYVLKTATGGYDGHGQKVIRSEADLEEAYALADSADCVLEEFVNFPHDHTTLGTTLSKLVTFHNLIHIFWAFWEHHYQLSNCMPQPLCSMSSASMSKLLKNMSQKIQAPTSTCMVK